MAGIPRGSRNNGDARYEDLLDSLQSVVFEMDLHGNITYSNKAAFEFFGYTEVDFGKGINALDSVAPEERGAVLARMQETLNGSLQGVSEYTILRTDGRRFPALIQTSPLVIDGRAEGFRGVIIDNSTHRKVENLAGWLNIHDPLTGLANRAYFEQEVRRLKSLGSTCGVIICDVDGLKLVNDTWGHEQGDALLTAVAIVLQEIVPQEALIARTGGDEFAILFPGATRETVEATCARIADAVSNYSSGWEFPLGTSVGSSFAESGDDIVRAMREADAAMYLEKLKRSQSVRSAVVQTLIKALDHKDFGSSREARLQDLTVELAKETGFPSYRFDDLRLFARLHDIGKVAIPDSILFKAGPLTRPEEVEMKRHCEVGYRIATSTADLVPIADWILKHHERWDGKGYPLGLKGEEIPMECRVFAVCDAFCSMTGFRPYRAPVAATKAIEEIRRCSGTQFDPFLVDKLCKIIETASDEKR